MGRTKNNYPLFLSISFLFPLSLINYLDRVTLSDAGKAIAGEFGMSPVQLGYFFSSVLWSYVLCVVPYEVLADRVGPRIVALGGNLFGILAPIVAGVLALCGALASQTMTRSRTGTAVAGDLP